MHRRRLQTGIEGFFKRMLYLSRHCLQQIDQVNVSNRNGEENELVQQVNNCISDMSGDPSEAITIHTMDCDILYTSPSKINSSFQFTPTDPAQPTPRQAYNRRTHREY